MTEEDQHSWKLAKAFIEGARGYSLQKTQDYADNYKFFVGENHYPTPDNYRALVQYGWRNRGIRNWTFATIDHKASVVLGTEPRVHVAGLQEDLDLVTRFQISSFLESESRRIHYDEIREDIFLDGAVTGKGAAHYRMEYDKVSERYSIVGEPVDFREFHVDPTASRLRRARYVVWDPIMEMSDIRSAFPDRYHLVEPESNSVGFLGGDSAVQRSDQEMVVGTAMGDYAFGRDGSINVRRARVSWVWVKDETLIEDIEEKILKDPVPGFECVSCGESFDSSEAVPVPGPSGAMPTCPDCESGALNPITMPAVVEKVPQPPRRLYPFGRLIVISGNALLYDGPNPHHIEGVFPFADYTHYRIPRRYHGFGDLQLLRSSQSTANRIVAMGIDYMRLSGNGPFEYPADAEAYTNLGAAPGQLVPVAAHLVGLARWVTPQGYDIRMHQMLDAIVLQDFQRVGGVTDVSTGVSPSAPTSGIEVQARQAAASTRLGKHAKNLGQFDSDSFLIIWQLAVQHYIEERAFMAPDFLGQAEAMRIVASMLPANISIEVTCNPDQIDKDKLMGQNLAGLIQSGALFQPQILPFLDVFLVAMGMDWATAKDLQRRVALMQQVQPAEPPPDDQGNPPTDSSGAQGGPGLMPGMQ